jgi:hypothetical protein
MIVVSRRQSNAQHEDNQKMNTGDEVIINDPDHWAHGHVGIITAIGKVGARVQLSSRQGSAIVRLTSLEK